MVFSSFGNKNSDLDFDLQVPTSPSSKAYVSTKCCFRFYIPRLRPTQRHHRVIYHQQRRIRFYVRKPQNGI